MERYFEQPLVVQHPNAGQNIPPARASFNFQELLQDIRKLQFYILNPF